MAAELRSRVAAALMGGHIKRVTFDVFDTCLTRRHINPGDLFLNVGARVALQTGVSPEAFQRARIRAEVEVRRQQHDNGTIDGIYNVVGEMLGLDQDLCQGLVSAELEEEWHDIFSIPGALDVVEFAKDVVGSVDFLSDMYLPPYFIEALLVREGFISDDSRVLVSSATSTSKRSGSMFAEYIMQHEIGAHQCLHVGNDEEVDVRMPLRIGMQVVPAPRANPNRFEAALGQRAPSEHRVGSRWGAVSRRIRLEAEDILPPAIAQVAASVGGPVFTAYVAWVLHQAAEDGIECLYFLARDGQVLLRLAHVLAPYVAPGIECRYLYASRAAWRIPALAPVDALTQVILLRKYEGAISVGKLAVRAGIPEWLIKESCDRLGIAMRDRYQATIGRDELSELLDDRPIIDAIGQASMYQKELMMSYLEAESCFSGRSWGIVDLGWHGSLQACLTKVIGDKGRLPAGSYYFGLFDSQMRDICEGSRAFGFDLGRGPGGNGGLSRFVTILETLAIGTEGSAMGYHRVDGSDEVAVILDDVAESTSIDWSVEAMQDVIVSFAAEAVTSTEIPVTPEAMAPAIEVILSELWEHPRFEEALHWGAVPHSRVGMGSMAVRLARPYTVRDVLVSLRDGGKSLTSSRGWVQGSLALTPSVIRGVARRLMRW